MKSLRLLDVTYRGHGESLPLGQLADNGRELLFEYSPQALARGLELSPLRLALRSTAYPDQQRDFAALHGLPGLLYDSLPDGWGMSLMDRRFKALGMDPATVSVLDRLATVGDHAMGALTYAPAVTDDDTPSTNLDLSTLAHEVQALLQDADRAVLTALARAGGSPGGARPKALVWYDPDSGQMSTQAARPAEWPAAEPWMVKFPAADEAAETCALEEVYARLARACGMDMEPTCFFALPGGLTAFATRRFDRGVKNAQDQRMHVHSLAGLLHANFQVPSIGYGDWLRATRHLTRDQREVRKALQYCVFNVLMHNRDDHAKNLAYRLHADGTWHCAPPFDLTFCLGYRGEHFMDVAGEAKQPTRAHVLRVAAQGGLSAKEANQVIDVLLVQVDTQTFARVASDLPILKKTVTQVGKLIETNRNALA